MGQGRDRQDELRAGFRAPSAAEYGNVPFWWWDGDELDEKRLTDQLETLKEGGVEAVCFEQKYPHGPPEGPQAPYFSEECGGTWNTSSRNATASTWLCGSTT